MNGFAGGMAGNGLVGRRGNGSTDRRLAAGGRLQLLLILLQDVAGGLGNRYTGRQ